MQRISSLVSCCVPRRTPPAPAPEEACYIPLEGRDGYEGQREYWNVQMLEAFRGKSVVGVRHAWVNGANVNAISDGAGNTSLMLALLFLKSDSIMRVRASYQQKIQLVWDILKDCTSETMNAVNRGGQTALQCCLVNGIDDAGLICAILERTSIEKINKLCGGQTILEDAYEHKVKFLVIQFLLPYLSLENLAKKGREHKTAREQLLKNSSWSQEADRIAARMVIRCAQDHIPYNKFHIEARSLLKKTSPIIPMLDKHLCSDVSKLVWDYYSPDLFQDERLALKAINEFLRVRLESKGQAGSLVLLPTIHKVAYALEDENSTLNRCLREYKHQKNAVKV